MSKGYTKDSWIRSLYKTVLVERGIDTCLLAPGFHFCNLLIHRNGKNLVGHPRVFGVLSPVWKEGRIEPVKSYLWCLQALCQVGICVEIVTARGPGGGEGTSFPSTRRWIRERRKRPKSWKLQRSQQRLPGAKQEPSCWAGNKEQNSQDSLPGDKLPRVLAVDPMQETM